MDEMHRLLDEAGQRWRALQPPPVSIDPASLAHDADTGAWRLLAAGAAGAAIALVGVAIVLQLGIGPRFQPDLGAAHSGAGASTPAVTDQIGCSVTRPVPAFVPPSPYPAAAPPLYESEWFGSEALWTMVERDGGVFGPQAITLGVKTLWWSSDWPGMRAEPEPAITVVGTRLDGPGSFTVDDATNAYREDFGEAMLVGVEFPTAGCWQLTARYGDAVLSYVVLVNDK